MDGKILGRVVALLVGMAFVLAPGLVATAHAADDPYTAGISTRCSVGVPAELERGDRVTIRLGVRANTPSDTAPARGTIRVRLTRNGDVEWTRQVPYLGKPVQVPGPRMVEAGRYVATTQFAPEQASTYRGCSGRATLGVVNGLSPNVDGPDGNDNGTAPQGGDLGGTDGLLPETGGPNSAWLVLALLLVGGGGGLVLAARGRREPDYEF